MPSLFNAGTVGDMKIPNRIVMAPLTRCRAGEGDVPVVTNTKYYAQRASAAFIITEATNISPRSCAFEHAPGIWSQDQVKGWRGVTKAVHEAGGRIFLQLWHCGRVGAEGILDGAQPLSPSGVNDDLDALQVYGLLKNGSYVRIAATPSRAMTISEIREAVNEYRTAARNAIDGGCDGVEVHIANGYLLHQFLSPTINIREDEYGGSVENRARIVREVLEAIRFEVPMSKVGVRISPTAAYNNVRDPNPRETYEYVSQIFQEFGVAYVHICDINAWAGAPDLPELLDMVKPHYQGPIIANAGITPEAAEDLIADGKVDAVAFGRMFLANPDLPARISNGGPYNELRYTGLYGGGETGYTDYPVLEAVSA
ncbi:alkene reductase [Paraburkholderia elongata]|uniref:Alkene reductase n=1 Tax=Paraburkholderia elongata TaxID=2675747 RepID=A0A972P1U7_9BURK|nr:alkene reductase [Paraburkholderia elongata]NPT62629.1 alkene reductase [Paraburkholderia elongata]